MTVLEADAVGARTRDGTDLLRDVSLTVADDELLLLCGSPGAGKTLLLKALEGVLAQHEHLERTGSVRRNGRVGFVFQHPEIQLVRRRVRHDVAFGLENQGVPVDEISARIDRYADLLDAGHLLDRTIRDLSRGETTKVALLGVLVTEPDVVLLDEPLTALDYRNERLLLDAVARLRESGTSVVVSEHDLRDLLSLGDRAVVLERGVKTASGTPREVAPKLHEVGMKLPVATELALERGARGAALPVSADEE